MPVVIDGEPYYRTNEICRLVGISKSTFFRWLKKGAFQDARHVDRRGWRIFTQAELDALKAEVNQVRPRAAGQGDKRS